MKDGKVRDQDITASRSYDSHAQPHFARLDKQGTTSDIGGWLSCGSPCGKCAFLKECPYISRLHIPLQKFFFKLLL